MESAALAQEDTAVAKKLKSLATVNHTETSEQSILIEKTPF